MFVMSMTLFHLLKWKIYIFHKPRMKYSTVQNVITLLFAIFLGANLRLILQGALPVMFPMLNIDLLTDRPCSMLKHNTSIQNDEK